MNKNAIFITILAIFAVFGSWSRAENEAKEATAGIVSDAIKTITQNTIVESSLNDIDWNWTDENTNELPIQDVNFPVQIYENGQIKTHFFADTAFIPFDNLETTDTPIDAKKVRFEYYDKDTAKSIGILSAEWVRYSIKKGNCLCKGEVKLVAQNIIIKGTNVAFHVQTNDERKVSLENGYIKNGVYAELFGNVITNGSKKTKIPTKNLDGTPSNHTYVHSDELIYSMDLYTSKNTEAKLIFSKNFHCKSGTYEASSDSAVIHINSEHFPYRMDLDGNIEITMLNGTNEVHCTAPRATLSKADNTITLYGATEKSVKVDYDNNTFYCKTATLNNSQEILTCTPVYAVLRNKKIGKDTDTIFFSAKNLVGDYNKSSPMLTFSGTTKANCKLYDISSDKMIVLISPKTTNTKAELSQLRAIGNFKFKQLQDQKASITSSEAIYTKKSNTLLVKGPNANSVSINSEGRQIYTKEATYYISTTNLTCHPIHAIIPQSATKGNTNGNLDFKANNFEYNHAKSQITCSGSVAIRDADSSIKANNLVATLFPASKGQKLAPHLIHAYGNVEAKLTDKQGNTTINASNITANFNQPTPNANNLPETIHAYGNVQVTNTSNKESAIVRGQDAKYTKSSNTIVMTGTTDKSVYFKKGSEEIWVNNVTYNISKGEYTCTPGRAQITLETIKGAKSGTITAPQPPEKLKRQ